MKIDRKNLRFVIVTVFLFICFFLFWVGHLKSEEIDSETSASRPSYRCYKINKKICIDGKLTEKCWKDKPVIPFRDIADGSEPEYETETKIVWDDRYLYIGFDIKDPDVWARVGFRDSEWSKEFAEKVIHPDIMYSRIPEWRRLECAIMMIDKFVKVFLDPDADGLNYVEFHINPLNNIFDAWYKQGFKKKWGDQNRYPKVSWTCPGLITATNVDGTLNAPHDIDTGWGVEMAIPWRALAPFTKGACPPKPGDIWFAHLGRTHKDRCKVREKNIDWAWTGIGQVNCHIPSTYGHLIFCDSGMEKKFVSLTGWLTSCDPEKVVPQSAEIGVTEIGTWSQNPQYLMKLVKIANKYNIDIYSTLTLHAKQWKRKYPKQSVPIQKMDEKENQAFAYYKKKNNRYQSNYQWGGEPFHNNEVLFYELLCFHDKQVKELLKEKIRALLKIDGLKGIAFDGFGYQNYRCCGCSHSMKLFEKYYQKHPVFSYKTALEKFSLETLVAFNSELAEYARSIKPDVKIINHIWPVFLPEPLYGNRIDIDYCGQTAAWFFYWDLAKIRRYSHIIASKEKKYHSRAYGVAMIGFYNNPDEFPLKTPERVEAELKAIFDGGCYRVQVCGLNDVLKTPKVAAVFRKYFKKEKK